MMAENQSDVWNRLPGETVRQFANFERYRLLGPRRSLAAACGKRVAPLVWYDTAERWRWYERATAWETAERIAETAQQTAQLETERTNRINTLKALRGKLTAQLQEADITSEVWQGIQTGLIRVTEALRSESSIGT
jgi:hypothetical protein